MGNDDLQKHLDNGMYGTPLLKPEEQHKYLGTFRERCYLTMSIAQMKKPINKKHLETELTLYPKAFVLLNGKLDTALQASYIKLITNKNMKFTIVNDYVSNKPDTLGLVLATNNAVDEPIIDVELKYPQVTCAEADNTSQKKSFWNKLFH